MQKEKLSIIYVLDKTYTFKMVRVRYIGMRLFEIIQLYQVMDNSMDYLKYGK